MSKVAKEEVGQLRMVARERCRAPSLIQTSKGEGRKNDDIQPRKVLQQQQEGNRKDSNKREGGGRGQNRDYDNRARNRHSYYEGQDRRDNLDMMEPAPAGPGKRAGHDEYSNYRNSRGGGSVGGSRELRRGQSFGYEGGYDKNRGGGFGDDMRRSTSPP